jgi:excisionase family DNA binding protein
MGRLINFDNFNPANLKRKGTVDHSSNLSVRNEESEADQCYQLTLDVLVKNNPDKVIFSIREAADILGVGEEFIRRRTKTGKIKATYLGDKPFINIVELARISTEGV